MLYLAKFDWEYAQLVSIGMNLVDGELILEIRNALVGPKEAVNLRVTFPDIAYLGFIRDNSIDRPPTEIKDLHETEGAETLAVEVDQRGKFIQMNFKDGWSRAEPSNGTFLEFNTYSLAAGALNIEWIAPSCEVKILHAYPAVTE